MTDPAQSPLLFLDVDGPLLPFGDGAPRGPSGDASTSHLARLDPQVGRRALLHHVVSSRGLTESDFPALDQWLRAAGVNHRI